jgi:hypothetical protein
LHLKIFPAEAPGLHCAYVLNGFIGYDSYDLISETKKQIEERCSQEFPGYREYVSTLSRSLGRGAVGKLDGVFASVAPENVPGEAALVPVESPHFERRVENDAKYLI